MLRKLVAVAAFGGAMLMSPRFTRADVVFAWNEALLHASVATPEFASPQLFARAFAIAHLAIDDAVNAVSGGANASLAAQRAAAITAAHDVMVALMPLAADGFDALAARHLAAIGDEPEKARGAMAGRAAAARLLAERENDGWTELIRSEPPYGPAPDASDQAAQALVRDGERAPSPWLALRPFGLKSARQFHLVEPRTVLGDGEVLINHTVCNSKLFEGLDPAEAVAAFETSWAGHPVITWNRIARQVMAGSGRDLRGQARMLALLNAALADVTLATSHWRHAVGSWRAVRGGEFGAVVGIPSQPADGARFDVPTVDPQLTVRQCVLIPPLPNYPSLSAAAAGAAQAVLARVLGRDEVAFTMPEVFSTGARVPQATRAYGSLSSAAKESAFIASLDGRFSREACVAGYMLGADIGTYIGKRRFRATR